MKHEFRTTWHRWGLALIVNFECEEAFIMVGPFMYICDWMKYNSEIE